MVRTSARDALRARADAVTSSVATDARTPATEPDATPEPSPAATPRTRPIKMTVELQPVEHRKLKAWCTAAADDLELPLIAGAEVLRVLWQLAQDDPDLAARVRDELARSGGSRRR
jgi:hypothetical protein